MPMYKKMGSDLLREAAAFFESVAEQNPAIKDAMEENASIYQQAADLLSSEPRATIGDKQVYEIASDLLFEAGKFFISISKQNPSIAEKMTENASVYKEMAELLNNDPMGWVSD